MAALQRCEEIIAANPAFSRIDEVLFMAGESSLHLAEGKGKQANGNGNAYDAYSGSSYKHAAEPTHNDGTRDTSQDSRFMDSDDWNIDL